MSILIAPERPDTPEAVALIDELEATLAPFYPAESRHGYNVEKLLQQGVSFFVARYEGAAAACGGVQFYDADYAEVKRMYVRPQFRGRGLAKRLLDHLAAHSLANGIAILRLETGVHQVEAIGLYERYGFQRIGPFGEYWDDPLSVFFEKRLA